MSLSNVGMLRKGLRDFQLTNYPGTDIRVQIIELKSDEIISAREEALKYINNHQVDIDTADLIFNMHTLVRAMREPEDQEIHFANSFEELNSISKPNEIYELHKIFLEVQNGKTPEFEEMTQEEFEEIKKTLGQMELKDFDGESQTILRCLHLTLLSRTLQINN